METRWTCIYTYKLCKSRIPFEPFISNQGAIDLLRDVDGLLLLFSNELIVILFEYY